MGNTVGSPTKISKFWQKQWISIKNDLVLTPEQKSVLIGSLLGDGTLRLGQRAINANFKVEHGLQQKEYVFWKYKVFRPWVFTEPKLSYRYDGSGKKYQKSWWFRTIRHPLLTELYRRFYKDGRKIVPPTIGLDLNPLALAVWVMDDGSFSKNKIDISTYSFTLPEIERLVCVFERNFGLFAKYYRDRDKGYRMYFDTANTRKLVSIIEPHVVPTMRYKLGRTP